MNNFDIQSASNDVAIRSDKGNVVTLKFIQEDNPDLEDKIVNILLKSYGERVKDDFIKEYEKSMMLY